MSISSISQPRLWDDKFEGIQIGGSALKALAAGENFEKSKFLVSEKKSRLIEQFLGHILPIRPADSRRPLQVMSAPASAPTHAFTQAMKVVGELRARFKANARPLLETAIAADRKGTFTFTATVRGEAFIEIRGIPANDRGLQGLKSALAGELVDKAASALLPLLSVRGKLTWDDIRELIQPRIHADISKGGEFTQFNNLLESIRNKELYILRNGADRLVTLNAKAAPTLAYSDGTFTLGGKPLVTSDYPSVPDTGSGRRDTESDDSSAGSRSDSVSTVATTRSSRSHSPISLSYHSRSISDLDEDIPPPPPFASNTEDLLALIESNGNGVLDLLKRIEDGNGTDEDLETLPGAIRALKEAIEEKEATQEANAGSFDISEDPISVIYDPATISIFDSDPDDEPPSEDELPSWPEHHPYIQRLLNRTDPTGNGQTVLDLIGRIGNGSSADKAKGLNDLLLTEIDQLKADVTKANTLLGATLTRGIYSDGADALYEHTVKHRENLPKDVITAVNALLTAAGGDTLPPRWTPTSLR